MIQPLNLGGMEDPGKDMTMLHPFGNISGAVPLVVDDDGGQSGEGATLYFGGEFADAQALVKCGTGSQFQFKFFVQSTRWDQPGDIERQVASGAWLLAEVSPSLLLKIREREGTLRPKPLWTEALELCGGKYKKVASDLLRGT